MKKRLIIIAIISIGIITGAAVFILRHHDKNKLQNSMGAFISETWYGDSYIFKCKNNIMYVYDITTGECLPLCSDPDCKHNSSDCTARTHDSRLGWKGVFIYENSLIEIMGMSGHTEIYRADTDGANRKLLAESDEFGINSACNFYADNGRLYMSTKYNKLDETTEEVSTFYGFAVFDIEREEFTDITSLSDKEDTFVRSICAADRKIYALLQSDNESGVYEIAGGKIQRLEIDKTNAQKLSAVGFERGRFYYQAYTGDAPIALYRLDLSTKEKEKLCDISSYVSNICEYGNDVFVTSSSSPDGVLDSKNVMKISCISDGKLTELVTNNDQYNYRLHTVSGEHIFIVRTPNTGWSDREEILMISPNDLKNGDIDKAVRIEGVPFDLREEEIPDTDTDTEDITDEGDNGFYYTEDFDLETEDESFFENKTKLVWALTESSNDKNHIQNEVNKYLDEKGYDFAVKFIHHEEVKIKGDGSEERELMRDYYKNALQSSEQIDIISSGAGFDGAYSYNEFVKNGYFIPLNKYFDSELGKKMYQAYPEWFWQTLSDEQGLIYGRGFLPLGADCLGISFNTELCDSYGIDISGYGATLEGLRPLLEKAKEKTGMPPMFIDPTVFIYYTNAGFIKYGGVFFNTQSGRFENIFESKACTDHLKLLDDYKAKGYITTDNSQATYETAIIYTGIIQPSSYLCERSFVTSAGFTNSSELSFVQGITASCKSPDKAFELLALCSTDKELCSLIFNGTNGRNYKFDDNEKMIKNLEHRAFDDWQDTPANYILADSAAYECSDKEEKFRELSENINVSPLDGFNADIGEFKDKLDSCAKIYEDNYKLFLTKYGEQKNLDDALSAANKQLKQAGIDEVLNELNKQFSEFLEEKK